MLCTLSQLSTGRWWCSRCDPNQKRTLPKNARRSCQSGGPQLASAALKILIDNHTTDCHGRKVNRQTLIERAEQCNRCDYATATACLAAGLPFRDVLPFAAQCCPESKFGIVCRIG